MRILVFVVVEFACVCSLFGRGAELLSLKTQNEREKREQEDARATAGESEKNARVCVGSSPVGEQQRHRRRELSPEATMEAHTAQETLGQPPPRITSLQEGGRRDDTAPTTNNPSAAIAVSTMRDMEVNFVKLFIVSQMQGFHVAGSPGMREFLETCAVPGFPKGEGDITPERVKHRVSELYAATKASFLREIGEVGGARGSAADATLAGPIFHASFEVWTPPGRRRGCASGEGELVCDEERYAGLRLHWLTDSFVLRSATLAAKRLTLGGESALFRGTAEGRGRSSTDGDASIIKWTREVLEEYGVSCESLFSTVTDAEGGVGCARGGGSGVGGGVSDVLEARNGRGCRRSVCAKLENSRWEWSVAHMLNTVLVQVTMRYFVFCVVIRCPLRFVRVFSLIFARVFKLVVKW